MEDAEDGLRTKPLKKCAGVDDHSIIIASAAQSAVREGGISDA
jgi:hypothetical protein